MTLTKIENIKSNHKQINNKTKFIIEAADYFKKSPSTIRNHWLGGFWMIPNDYQDDFIKLQQNWIKIQNEVN